MNSKSLALITGFGGINSAGRSSHHLSYKNHLKLMKYYHQQLFLENLDLGSQAKLLLPSNMDKY